MSNHNGIVQLILSEELNTRTAADSISHNASEKELNVQRIIHYTHPKFSKVSKSQSDIQLQNKLKEAIQSTRELGGSLFIRSNNYIEYFKESIFLDYLKILEESQVSFKIESLKELNKHNISTFLSIANSRIHNQEKAIEKSRKTTKSTINKKKYSAGVRALTSDKNLKNNRLKKRQLSDLDPNNIRARHIIASLKKDPKYTDYKIAKTLNEQGVRTSKNREFQPNTVSRQYMAHQELKSKFDKTKDYENVIEVFDEKKFHINSEFEESIIDGVMLDAIARKKQESNIEIADFPLDFNYETYFSDFIKFEFNEPLKVEIEFSVYNNQKELIHSCSIPKGKASLLLNIINDTSIGPGRYYARLTDNKKLFYEEKWIVFLVRPDVIPNGSNAKFTIMSPSDFQ